VEKEKEEGINLRSIAMTRSTNFRHFYHESQQEQKSNNAISTKESRKQFRRSRSRSRSLLILPILANGDESGFDEFP